MTFIENDWDFPTINVPQLLRAEEEMVFIHQRSIQCFGDYRILSGEKSEKKTVLTEAMKKVR